LDRTKAKVPIFQKTPGARIRDGGELGAGHTTPRRGLGLAVPGHGVVALGTPSVSLFAYKKPSDLKTTGGSTFFHENFRCTAATEGEIRGTESLYSGTLPGRGSAPGAISIDPHHHLHRPSMFLPSMSE